MTFGDKLHQLRKEKGMSQEALAEKLNTTRQAVSKWENGQGYPETEKLLMLGNIFDVSMDYLLKDTTEPSIEAGAGAGFYVSKEMAEDYLLSARKISRHMALGWFFIALAFIPYFLFQQDPSMYLIPTILLAIIGVGMFASVVMFENSQHKVLRKEPLLFDDKYLKSLSERYEGMKKRFIVINILGGCLFAGGVIAFGIERKYMDSDFLVPYYPVCIGAIAIGLYLITRTATLLDAYKLLANNNEYSNRIGFKLRKKIRSKIDHL